MAKKVKKQKTKKIKKNTFDCPLQSTKPHKQTLAQQLLRELSKKYGPY